MSVKRPKWFGATPLAYIPGPTGFWFRDLGALTVEFGRMGVDSQFVVYGTADQMEPGKPLILCSPQEMTRPEWWSKWQVDGVILNSWGAPQYTPIARAIKAAGARLIIRLDSDGLKSPRLDFWRFLSSCYFASCDSGQRLPGLYALSKSLALRLLPSMHDEKFCDHLAQADTVIVESMPAKRYVERLVTLVGRSELAAKLTVLPHFAALDRGYDPANPKRQQILAVGRWDAAQKDGPKLIRVLGKILAARPGYVAKVVGGGRASIEPLWRQLPGSIRQRMELTGQQPHEAVQQHCRESRIMLFTSRYEGFPFAASEALCCGCSVVGAATLPSMCHITTCGAGSVAISRSDDDFVDALAVEIEAWESGWRDPESISRKWMSEVSLRSVARKMLRLGKVDVEEMD